MKVKSTQAHDSRKPKPPPQVRRALNDVSEDLATWRKLSGLTQAQLADRAGISVNTLRRLEDADGGIALENLLRVLRALGLVEGLTRALDPYESELGRRRSEERLPQRIRTRDLTPDG